MAKMATREAYGKALAELAKENKKILVLDADLSGSTKTGEGRRLHLSSISTSVLQRVI